MPYFLDSILLAVFQLNVRFCLALQRRGIVKQNLLRAEYTSSREQLHTGA
jgi:hypothetical protein